jgi:Cu+-exporting ATPase
MPEELQITLPITGMTCANCVATVERNIKKVDGVSHAAVNLSSERATVEFNPEQASLDDVIGRVQRAGYGIATGQADLIIQRMSDDNDARRLEKTLNQLDGVLSAQVVYGAEKAQVKYIPTMISQAELRKAINEAGFKAVETGGDFEDAERKARQAEIAKQRHLLIVGLVFTIPLFLFAAATVSTGSLARLGHVGISHTSPVLCRLGLLRRFL